MATKKYLDLAGLQHFKEKNDLRYPVLEDALIPSRYLPSYVDDVLEYGCKAADESYVDAQGVSHTPDAGTEAFPAEGESGKIYVSKFSNKTYRWSGTQYTEISASLALGEGAGNAYPGNLGKANAEAIAALQTALQAEQTAREQGDEALQTQITNITTGDGSLGARLTAAEGAITKEVADRTQAVSDLNTRVDAIVEVNDDHDTRIKANLAAINQEVSDRTDAVSALDAAYKAADAAQTTAITTAYEAADTALDGKISANATAIATEVSDRTAAVGALDTAYKAADTALGERIDALNADIVALTNAEIDTIFA